MADAHWVLLLKGFAEENIAAPETAGLCLSTRSPVRTQALALPGSYLLPPLQPHTRNSPPPPPQKGALCEVHSFVFISMG